VVILEGRGLHGGLPCRLVLARGEGEVVIVCGGERLSLSAAAASGERRSTELVWGERRVRTTEHLLSALGGLGVHEGVTVTLEGDEIPLLDGRARSFVRALRELGASPSPAPLVVVNDGEFSHERTTMRFSVAEDTRVAVAVDFGDTRLAEEASWDGTAADYEARIAGARTFGFAHEVLALAARGLASHVAPESVVVIADEAIHAAGEPFLPDEPARHKLLDLIGDLYVAGGPPRGHVHARWPGHAATHRIVAKALAAGVLARLP